MIATIRNVIFLDALGSAGFVLGLAGIMGAFRSTPPLWGYPEPKKTAETEVPITLLGLVPVPRQEQDSEIGSRTEV